MSTNAVRASSDSRPSTRNSYRLVPIRPHLVQRALVPMSPHPAPMAPCASPRRWASPEPGEAGGRSGRVQVRRTSSPSPSRGHERSRGSRSPADAPGNSCVSRRTPPDLSAVMVKPPRARTHISSSTRRDPPSHP
jgi:hypothetical protein